MIPENESLKDKLLKRGKWLYISSALIGPIGYAIKIMLSHEFDPAQIGALYGVISLVVLVATYNDFGFTEALNYYLPKADQEKDWSRFKTLVAFVFASQIVTSAVVGGAFYFGSGWLAENYFSDPLAADLLRVFAWFFLGINLFQIFNTVFQVSQNTFLQKSTEFGRTVAMLAYVGALLAIAPWSPIASYAWAWIAGLAFGLAVSLWPFYAGYYRPYLRDARVRWDGPLLREFTRYSLWTLATANIAMVLSQIDMQLVVYFFGSEEAWYYSNYLSLLSIPFLFSAPILQFLFPVISHFRPEEARERIAAIKNFFFRAFVTFGGLVGAFFFAFHDRIATLLFGEKFLASGHILAYSCLFVVFNLLLQTNFQILAGTGRLKTRAAILLSGLVINIAVSLALLGSLGSRGISLAVGIAWIAIYAMSEYATRGYPLVVEYRRTVLNVAVTAALSAAGYFWISPALSSDRFVLFCELGALGVLYILCFALVNARDTLSVLAHVFPRKKAS